MDAVTAKELQSIAQMWAKQGCFLQDFIDAVSKAGYDFNDLHVAAGNDNLITFRLFPKGRSSPIETISVYK